MRLIPLIATKEFIDLKRGGIVVYDTDQTIDQDGIILMANDSGDYSLVIIDQVHRGGKVRVACRPIITPAKKYSVNDLVGYLAVFE